MSMTQYIEDRLTEEFTPSHLEVINESHGHNVPQGSESHMKVVIVSDKFLGEGLVNRHRMINQTLADCFSKGLHALALHTYTADEWQKRNGAPKSPACMGGSKAKPE